MENHCCLSLSKCVNDQLEFKHHRLRGKSKMRGNQPAGSGEEDFLRVFTIYGRGGHLGHVTSIMSSDFHFLVPESFRKKFGSDRYSSF